MCYFKAYNFSFFPEAEEVFMKLPETKEMLIRFYALLFNFNYLFNELKFVFL